MSLSEEKRERDPALELIFIMLTAVFLCILLMVKNSFDETQKIRCRGYEEQIEKSLERQLADETLLNSIQTDFQQYKQVCGMRT